MTNKNTNYQLNNQIRSDSKIPDLMTNRPINTINLPKKFKNFKAWLRYLDNDINSKVTDTLKFNTSDTAKNTWSAMNSTPTEVSEPIFEKIFKQKAEINSPEVLRLKSFNLRDEANESLQNKKDFSNITKMNSKIITTDLDTLFDLANKKFEILTPREAALMLPQNTTSSFPHFKKKNKILEKAIKQVEYIIASGDTTFIKYPFIVRWRTQTRKTGRKYRQFYMSNFICLIIEAMFFGPIINHFRDNLDTSYCLGNKFPNLSRKLQNILSRNTKILNIDFEKFDFRMRSELNSKTQKYIKSKLKIRNHVHNSLYDTICYYNNKGNVISSIKGIPCIFKSECGIKSGMFSTNLIGTFNNAIMQTTLKRHFNDTIKQEDVILMSDDCLIGYNKNLDLSSICEFFKKEFDAIVHPKKSEIYTVNPVVEDNIIYFLGYKMSTTVRYADYELMMNQLLYSENFIPESVLPTKTRLFSKLASISL